MNIAVILSQAQAEVFVTSRVGVQEVVSFCPSATYYLRVHGYRVTSVAEHYRALSHAKTVVLVARELPRVMQTAIQHYHLDTAEEESVRVYLYLVLGTVYYLHGSLRCYRGKKSKFFWVDDAQVAQGDYDAMFLALAMHIQSQIVSYAQPSYSVAHYALALWFNRVVASRVMRSKRVKVIDFGDELPKRIITAMLENGDNPLVLHTHRLGRNMLQTARFFVKSLLRLAQAKADGKPIYMFRAAPPQAYQPMDACEMPALHTPLAAEIMKRTLQCFVPCVRAEAAAGRAIVRAVRPDIAVADHAEYPYVLAGLEEMGRYGGKHAMLNHSTHTMQYDSISRLAAMLWAQQQRIINQNTTHSLPKSPLTAELAKAIRADDAYEICKINVYGKIENKASAQGKFVILHAGNYTSAYNYIPWCKETADEYLLAIVELLEEVNKLENVELIIKLKNKKADTHKTIVEEHIQRLNMADKARVDTNSRFSEVMARAHVIVCNISGTVEEALANHIPVMIHTYRKSYFHIPKQVVAASAKGNAAPAYLVEKREDIGRIITTMSAMRGQLNNPELYGKIAWQPDERMTMQTFARKLVGDARKPKRES